MPIIRILFVLLLAIVVIPVRLLFRWLSYGWSVVALRLGFSGNVVILRDDDPGMAEAKAEAVATVPEFLRRLAEPGVDLASAAVKAPLAVFGGAEHVWLRVLRYENGEFVGTVDNTPTLETHVQAGDVVRIRQSDISDWQLVERSQLVGGFTIRYFLSRMPAKRQAQLRASLPFTIGPEAIPRAS